MFVAGLVACDVIEEGYLSKNIHYTQNPLEVAQGSTVFSAAIAGDNSTAPFHVELLDIRNVRTGQREPAWYGEGEVAFWLEEINPAVDSTWDQVFAKYSRKAYPIFQVNPVGGRLEFTEGTRDVPVGDYEIDVKVTNVRGSIVLKNACTILLGEQASFFSIGDDYNLWNSATSGTRPEPKITYRELTGADLTAFQAKLSAAGGTFEEDYGYMVVKVLDNYGKAFSWAGGTDPFTGGQIRQRTDASVGCFENRSPWQKMFYTDDAIITPFRLVPFPLVEARTSSNQRLNCYRVIPSATTLGMDIYIRFSWEILRMGVFEVTYQMTGADDNGIVEKV
jgi:hypothetical protein